MEVINRTFLEKKRNYKKGVKGFSFKPDKERKSYRLVVKLNDKQKTLIDAYTASNGINRVKFIET